MASRGASAEDTALQFSHVKRDQYSVLFHYPQLLAKPESATVTGSPCPKAGHMVISNLSHAYHCPNVKAAQEGSS